MKKSVFTFVILFILTIFIQLPTLRAQQGEAVTVIFPSQNIQSSFYSKGGAQQVDGEEMTYTLNMAAGQQTARFNDIETYLKNNLIFPKAAADNGIEGTVKVLVIISREGKVMDAKIIESLGFGCDEAALEVVQNMPAWTPAMNYGIPVQGKKILEINFWLQ